MKFAVLLFAAAILALPALAPAQTTDPNTSLQFDVAIIKPAADTSAPGLIVHMAGERGYHGVNMALLNYFMVAYQVRGDQVTGPDWISQETFDVEGKAGRTCTADELHLMLQHLLEDRFHLKLRFETKDLSGYNLVVDTGGPKLTVHDPEDHTMLPMHHGPGMHTGTNVAMQYLAFFLSEELGQKVVDKTGLSGHYDFKVTWGASNGPMMIMPPPPPGAPTPTEVPQAQAPGESVFEALRKQLGLRLDKAKVPSQHIFIDHIEKLSDN